MGKLKYSLVNFQNLIQDLVDMYPYNIFEVIITELVANSLDAKASDISIAFNKDKNLLVVEDNGMGMTKRQFDQYHDFAAGLKARGDGIGFAGLGAKISFSIASRVQTETYSPKFKGRSNWYLKSQKELVWEKFHELSELKHEGTRVEVYFNIEKKQDIPIMAAGQNIREILLKHFLPLFDIKFLDMYDTLGFYGKNLRFKINGTIIKPFELEKSFKLSKVKKVFFESDGKRYGYGLLAISEDESIEKNDAAGIGISVYGKIIQHDFFGQFPGELASNVFGILEVPPFIKFLNTSKTGFIKSRGSSQQFNKFYEPLRENFKIWLNEIGVKSIEVIDSEEAIKLEQEVKKLLLEIPEVKNLFDLKSRTNALAGNELGDIKSSYSNGASRTSSDKSPKSSKSPDLSGSEEGGGNPENTIETAGKINEKNIAKGINDIGTGPGESLVEDLKGMIRSNIASRRKKSGFKISFANRNDRADLAWIEKDIIIINSSHPSYLKIRKSSAGRKVHNIFSIAIALSREMQDQGIIKDKDLFIDEIMSKWGKIKI
ncbi:MAG: ATP-binding protein [Actinobacteria bacterium]|nr:ATP-binding protein [Actinomycetota bacterium]